MPSSAFRPAPRPLLEAASALLVLALSFGSAAAASSVVETDIISDGKVPAQVIDKTLINPWGISYPPGGPFWVSINGSGTTQVYDGQGQKLLTVTIPSPPKASGPSSPTGQVFNSTKDFAVSENGKSAPASFLFATEDGTISGWSASVDAANAVLAIDNSKNGNGAVYKGITIFSDNSGSFLLAANFRAGLVEVYDGQFHPVRSFRDHRLPANYAPFNILTLNGALYVTYAVQQPGGHDDMAGPGNGFLERVDVFGNPLASVNTKADLNSPWGLVLAPSSFGPLSGTLLVGNFGDGRIHAFNASSLVETATLVTQDGKPLVIDGLWGLIVGNGGKGGDLDKVYFAAGINDEMDGLFGNLRFVGGS